MKKLRTALIVLASACAAVSALAFAGCEDDKHTCDWGEWEITPATCTTAGSKVRHCKGDPSHVDGPYVIEVDPAAHNYKADWTVDVEANCTTVGSKSHHCEYCGDKKDVTEIPVNPAAHKYKTDWTVDEAATCSAVGSKSHHCELCDAKTDVTEIPVDATAHKYKTDWTVDVEATCAVEGSKSHHCEYCNAKTDVTSTGTLSHVYDEDFTVDEEPTCAAEGSKSRHCSNPQCNAKTDLTPIEKLAHTWGAWAAGTPADDGSVKAFRTCTACPDGVEEKSFAAFAGTISGACDAPLVSTLYTFKGMRTNMTLALNKLGTYTLVFDYFGVENIKISTTNVTLNGVKVFDSNYAVVAQFASTIRATNDGDRVLGLEITVDNTNIHSELFMGFAKNVKDNPFGFNISVPAGEDVPRTVVYGDNNVVLNTANKEYEFEFISGEAKKYSISVPVAGLQIAIERASGAALDIISSSASGDDLKVNFDMAAGEKVVFIITTATKGTYKVNIGEPKEEPKLVLDADPMACEISSNNQIKYNGATMFSIAVADDVAEGEYYLAFAGYLIERGRGSAGSFTVYVNDEKVAMFGPGSFRFQSTNEYYAPLVADNTMKLILKGGDVIKVENANTNGGEATIALTSTYEA